MKLEMYNGEYFVNKYKKIDTGLDCLGNELNTECDYEVLRLSPVVEVKHDVRCFNCKLNRIKARQAEAKAKAKLNYCIVTDKASDKIKINDLILNK